MVVKLLQEAYALWLIKKAGKRKPSSFANSTCKIASDTLVFWLPCKTIFNIVAPSNIAYVPVFIELAGISILPRFKFNTVAPITSCLHGTRGRCLRSWGLTAPNKRLWGEQLPTKKHWQSSRWPQMWPQIQVQYHVCKLRLSSYLLQALIFAESRLVPYRIGIYDFYTLHTLKISLLGSRQTCRTAYLCLPNWVPYAWDRGRYTAFVSRPLISGLDAFLPAEDTLQGGTCSAARAPPNRT